MKLLSLCLLSLLCLPLSLGAQTVHPHCWDGSIYLRVAGSTPQLRLPEGNDGPGLLTQLAGYPALQQVFARYGLQRIEKFGILKVDELQRTYIVDILHIERIEAFIADLEALPEVELAEKRPLDRVLHTPNDPQSTSLWHLQKIRAFDAWDLAQGSTEVKVGVVDDAVRTTHQDLSGNLLTGWDIADNDNNPNPPSSATSSSFSHGTHCAGIVSARTNNGVGIAAIGYNVKIIPVKASYSSSDGKSIHAGYQGVQKAVELGANIISMSWGSSQYSATHQTVMNAAHNAGVMLVGAAGNESVSTPLYPAAYNNVIAVAATAQSDAKASFSNYGSWVDISSPGVSIYSTVAGANGSNNSYQSYNGTSMATPLVAGLLALAKSYKPTATNAEIISCLYSSADNINSQNPNFTGQLGAGRINAYALLQCLGATAPAHCNGQQTFTATSGNLSDGSGSNNYQNNASCSWLIQPNDGGRVRLTFSAMSTESDYDLVRVYDGATTGASLLGSYSGTSLPPQLTSAGNALLVTFTSDESNTAAGFSASWTSIAPAVGHCSGSQTLTGNTGTISDGSGSNNYQSNADCSWLIQPSNGGRVQLSFSAFGTESCCDFLRVYDGTSATAPLLGTYSGSSLPPQLTSTGSALFLRFTSDFSVTGAGFSASYTSLTTTQQCSGQQTLTENSGSFSDGSGSGNYAHNASCSWRIQPSNGGVVQLNFTSFRTENGYDFVRIYDGSTTSAPLLATYSGTTLPASVTSTGNAMLVTFSSDASLAEDGFTATWTSIPLKCNGLVVLQNSHGTISDGPNNYDAFADCSWRIITPGATGIQLTFTQFQTESSYDFVKVYNGANASAPLLGNYSGTPGTPFTVSANSGQMFIQFSSDVSVQSAGFTANYTALGVATSRHNAEIVACKLYPNPASDAFILELAGNADLILYNTLGQPVRTQSHRDRTRLPVADLPPGVYSLRVVMAGVPPFALKCTVQ
ncbi:MAG: S8 family serine peptidase [Bacteroidetes bacterium]|nr:S8 family serine peptidase [Bacteroidota bacterium]